MGSNTQNLDKYKSLRKSSSFNVQKELILLKSYIYGLNANYVTDQQ